MKKKRERFEVIYDILSTVRSKRNIGPTRLLQLSNLSPKMFRDYIKELKSTGLLEEKIIENKKRYHLTDKAYIFLEKYDIFINFVDNLGL